MKLALLSNVNMDPVRNILAEQFDVFKNEGFGGIIENLINPASGFNHYDPDIVFIIVDISLLTQNCIEKADFEKTIGDFFAGLSGSLNAQKTYFVSTTDSRSFDAKITVSDSLDASLLESLFNTRLLEMVTAHSNVHIFQYKQLAEAMGKDTFYSNKLWYLGKIIHTAAAHDKIAKEIKECLRLYEYTPKKALLLDLDNTLWGGVIGEDGIENIVLSEEKMGMIYKDAQRVLLKMRQNGVILGIVSKNNEADALEVIEKHPHMLLRRDSFAIIKANWKNKNENIMEIADTLNIGLDSIVFVDDSLTEQEIVQTFLPDVTVPEFPRQIERLPEFFLKIYNQYFKRLSLTEEDRKKTQQYKDNARRAELETSVADFPSFLKGLEIEITPIVPKNEHLERFYQLINKTNQFNLTTRRYGYNEISEMIGSENAACFLFSMKDKFGEYGIISAVIVDLFDGTPRIDSFVLSCRAMGKLAENYIIDHVEGRLLDKGYEKVIAEYIPTPKNGPAKRFFDKLGYDITDESERQATYEINLLKRPARIYYVKED